MDPLTIFGTVAVTAMMLFYALERRSRIFVLLFAEPAWQHRPMVFCKAHGRSGSWNWSGQEWHCGAGRGSNRKDIPAAY